MQYPILIPSRGRAGDVLTLQSIPRELWNMCYLVVPEEELRDYQKKHEAFQDNGGIVYSCTDYSYTISQKRQKMVSEIADGHHDAQYFWMMDDDLKFFRRLSEFDTRLIGLSGEHEYREMFEMNEEIASGSFDRFCAIGISMRQGNNQLEWPGVYNVRLIRCGLFHTESFLAARHNRLRFMGDFDVMIQMLKMGKDNYVTTKWAQDHRGTNARGGCETSRDEQAMEDAANGLAAFHPDCVKTKQKENKGGKLAVRTDVTIYWKKARANAAS